MTLYLRDDVSRALRRARLYALAGVAWFSTGCASAPTPELISDARHAVDATDAPIAAIDQRIPAVQGLYLAACTGTTPLLTAEQCGPAHDALDELVARLHGLADALKAADLALAVVEAMAAQ